MPDPRTVVTDGVTALLASYDPKHPMHRPDPTGDQPPMPALHDAVHAALTAACLELELNADIGVSTVNALAEATAAHLERSDDWTLFHVEPGQMHYQAPAIPGDPDLEFLALAAQQLDALADRHGVHVAARAARYLADRYAPEADT